MPESNNRKHIRFAPDENTLITITLPGGNDLVGLAFSEAYAGCGGVFINNHLANSMKVGDIFALRIGSLDIENAEVRWIKQVDEHITKAGFHLLD